jgi:hypothetical protein
MRNVDCINLAQDMNKWQADFSRMALLHGVKLEIL